MRLIKLAATLRTILRTWTVCWLGRPIRLFICRGRLPRSEDTYRSLKRLSSCTRDMRKICIRGWRGGICMGRTMMRNCSVDDCQHYVLVVVLIILFALCRCRYRYICRYIYRYRCSCSFSYKSKCKYRY